MRRWPRSSKNERKRSRISAAFIRHVSLRRQSRLVGAGRRVVRDGGGTHLGGVHVPGVMARGEVAVRVARRAAARWSCRCPSRAGSGCGTRSPTAARSGSAARPPRRSARARRFSRGSGTGIAGQQRLGVGVDRLRVELLRRRDLHQLAEVHHRDAVGDVPHDAQVVGDEQVGQARTRPGGRRAG